MTTPPIWSPGVLRLSFFRKDHGLSGVGLKDLFGLDPENTQINGPMKDRTETAPFGPGMLVLSDNVARFDCVWEVAPFGQPDGEVPTLGELDSAITSLLAHTLPFAHERRWARLALGIVGFSPVTTLEQGYALIDERLPELKIPSEGVSDFIYQINRHYPFSFAGDKSVRMNRLSKWSVATFQSVMFDLPLVTSGIPQVMPSLQEVRAMRAQVEVDLNTAAEYQGEFSGGDLDIIFNEMMSKGKEIMSNGHNI